MKFQRNAVIAIGAIAAFTLVVGGTAGAKALITGKDIKNGTIAKKDLKDDSVGTQKVTDGSLKIEDFNSTAQRKIVNTSPVSPPTSAPAPGGQTGLANWGVIHRNVTGGGDASLGVQTVTPPLGVGALDVRTGSSGDKTAFGNQQDFRGDPLSGVTEIGFSVFTTGENIQAGGRNSPNMPNIGIEVDWNGSRLTPGDFTTLVFIPRNTAPGAWRAVDATDPDRGFQGGGWYYTGTEGTDSGCNQVSFCTFAEAKAAFPSATILSIAVTKGRDHAFSGAVDALVVNARTFDFEPGGVF